MKVIKNIAASVHSRLLDRARGAGRPFQEFLEHFGMERFLYRLSRSAYVERFVLKGALMLRVWDAPGARPTRDIDLMGRVENSLENLALIIQEICQVDVEADGLRFNPKTVVASRIKEDADYQGVRICFEASLGNAKFPMQIDVGFGDRMVPPPGEITFPTLLDFPAPCIKGYAKETTIAEKFEAMAMLGTTNSRMKDFYDIRFLASRFSFVSSTLAGAIRSTFDQRSTPVPLPNALPVALTETFSRNAAKELQWRAFLRRSKLDGIDVTLEAAVQDICRFLIPVLEEMAAAHPHAAVWPPGGPWPAAPGSP